MERRWNNSESSSVSQESLQEAGGPDFADFARQLQYENEPETPYNRYYSPYNRHNPDNVDIQSLYVFPSTLVEKKETPPKMTDVNSIFLIDSMNRDRQVYPQPTTFTLRTPRVYKNIKSIQISQLKLLSSFYYFSGTKGNIFIPVIEKGRESITTYNGKAITALATIHEGTYQINDLLAEIQRELNYTPLFYDFPNGLQDFSTRFSTTGDLGLNFNQPGDTYYDILNAKYITNPTQDLIISYYWNSRYTSIVGITPDQILVAYYYPVLYEVILDKLDTLTRPSLNLNISSQPSLTALYPDKESIMSHIVYNTFGINDPLVTFLIKQNQAILDIYRTEHTFQYSLINRYQLAYDTNSLRVNIVSISLNTSLVNLINNTISLAFSNAITNNGLTLAGYSNVQTVANTTSAIYTDMFQYLQTQLVQYLAVPFGTYSPIFFNNLSNSIYFQDGRNAQGITSNYIFSQLNASAITSSKVTFSNSPGYWPRLTPIFNATTQINSSLIPYDITNKNFIFNTSAIDSNFHINTVRSTRSVDVIATISSAKYTVFKFRSPVRQTLQVETLPLPYYYRYADYNKTGSFSGYIDPAGCNVPQKYFDISYSYVYDSTNSNMDILNYNPRLLNPIFGRLYELAFQTAGIYTLNPENTSIYFEFTAPYPPPNTSGLYKYKTNISFVAVSPTLYTGNFSMFVYHDRAVFMADLRNIRNENPLHYKHVVHIDSTMSSASLSFDTFSGNKYYIIFRSAITYIQNISFKSLIYYTDSTYSSISATDSNFNPFSSPYSPSTNLLKYPYTTNYDTDFIRLPTKSSLMGIDPANSTFSVNLSLQSLPIGYDISGVSNDLTDYMGLSTIGNRISFYPGRLTSVDPLTQYTFQSNSPFNTSLNTYFGQDTLNAIFTPIENVRYESKSTLTSQLKIVHWYDGYRIPRQIEDRFTTLNNISTAHSSNLATILPEFLMNASGDIQFGRGIHAIGFLPTDGSYSLEDFTFKSYIYPTGSSNNNLEDPNLQIKYIGVFSGATLMSQTLSLSTALTVMSSIRSVTYGPNTATYNSIGSNGTWYSYRRDSNFQNQNINGYTPGSNDLLSHISMYYMVPFDSNFSSMTYSQLSGSILPYPLAQTISTGSNFFGKSTITGQPVYIMPLVDPLANTSLGPQNNYSQIQSQYNLSIPITATSLAYKEVPLLVNNTGGLFTFQNIYQTTESIQLTTFFTEYSDTLFRVNTSASNISKAGLSYPSASISSFVQTYLQFNGISNTSSIYYLLNPPSTLQNSTVTGKLEYNSTFTYDLMSGENSNFTTKSLRVIASMSTIDVWMWAGGGGCAVSGNSTGGAGAYVKVSIDAKKLLDSSGTPDAPGGISTLYFVVGKGGNNDNFPIKQAIGFLQEYGEVRYGGGGTSLLGNYTDSNSICLQGGGFSGIFTSPDLLNATPLLIVGGGGAGGATDSGGQGGFGILQSTLPISTFLFSSAISQTILYSPITINSVVDVFGDSNISKIIDGNLTTAWNPISRMNITNYFPTTNMCGFTLECSNPLSNISKIRYYGSDSSGLATGIIVYNDTNKIQTLYSNTSIMEEEFLYINSNPVYEVFLNEQLNQTNYNGAAWLVGGTTGIQYSVDGFNWVQTNLSLSIRSIQYAIGTWYALDNSGIFYISTDGINWNIDSSLTDIYNTLLYYDNFGGIPGASVFLAGGNNGNYSIKRGTNNWEHRTIPGISNIRKFKYLNGLFYVINNTGIKTSADGIIWSSVALQIQNINDMAYGNGRYVAVQSNRTPPYLFGILFSNDGITWNQAGALNLAGFFGQSIVYANGLFVACGITADRSSSIKYSVNGVNWLNSSLENISDIQRTDISYLNGYFICLGEQSYIQGKTENQASIVRSVDGINWSYSLMGGFTVNTIPYTSDYGNISITPNLNKIYIEIQSHRSQPVVNEIRMYGDTSILPAYTVPMLDNDNTTTYYPDETLTEDTFIYTYFLSFSNTVSRINSLSITVPFGTWFTGLTIKDSSSNIIYYDSNVAVGSFIQTIDSGIYTANFIPELSDVISFTVIFVKETPGRIEITDIVAIYNNNTVATQIPFTVQNIDYQEDLQISSISDGYFENGWSGTNTAKLLLTYTSNKVNHIQIINNRYNSDVNIIQHIGVYTDTTKTGILFDPLTKLEYKEYYGYRLIEFDILPLLNATSIYIEMTSFTLEVIQIQELRIFSLGVTPESPAGYAGGTNLTIRENISALSPYNGGGGSTTEGGYGGVNAYTGIRLAGGSPVVIQQDLYISNTSQISSGAGGGGGGYWGGGGGGNNINIGGAGGGGSGFITNLTFVELKEYDTASIQSSYGVQGLNQYQILVERGVIIPTSIPVGQGATSNTEGKGGHGLIVLSYTQIENQPPINSSSIVIPSFIDGSQLSLFNCPIDYINENRILNFTRFSEMTEQNILYNQRNWVWLQVYLKLIGSRLTKSMALDESIEFQAYPFLGIESFTYLTSIYNRVYSYFYNILDTAGLNIIIFNVELAFTSFLGDFVNTSYNEPAYETMTELYCLLDYLRNMENLTEPHIKIPTLDRVFGGLPGFGYWANPFLKNVSYIGFDVMKGQVLPPSLTDFIGTNKPVRAMYGLVMEQDLRTGVYEFKDIMAYKPELTDAYENSYWYVASQFPLAYYVRSLTNNEFLDKNIPVQPYTFKNAISGRLPLFKYSVYSIPTKINSITYDIPVQILNDFEGGSIYMYSFQNFDLTNWSTINIGKIQLPSTILKMNQMNINNQVLYRNHTLGTLITINSNTTVSKIIEFSYSNYTPRINYSNLETFSSNSILAQSNVGSALVDMYGNLYFSARAILDSSNNLDTSGNIDNVLYQNIGSSNIRTVAFTNNSIRYSNPAFTLNTYNSSGTLYNDTFFSKFSNIWHTSLTDDFGNTYGVRLTNIYDFSNITRFANQIFYPTHKITLIKSGSQINPMINNVSDLTLYPSYEHTVMFFYKNYTSLVNDIDNKFGMEKASNFTSMNVLSGYNFKSYINNINLENSSGSISDCNSYNYIAIRGYSPSEEFKTLVRFSLPQRYDFGYMTLQTIVDEISKINTYNPVLVNPKYNDFLQLFNGLFSTSKTYASASIAGYSGSTILTTGFGDFLEKYYNIYLTNTSNTNTISSVIGLQNQAVSSLISGDLVNIIPVYIRSRNRVIDPIEFKIPFSTCVTPSNADTEQYGIGYNLGFALEDTSFTTSVRATSFFKILDDYIYLQMNPENSMNAIDISQQENLSRTRDPTAQSKLYNSKLLLNTFGSFATTFVQNPITFNPPLGKLDKLSFSWYDINGNVINNADCEWSAAIQIVESVETPA
jgi:hypothetical protein